MAEPLHPTPYADVNALLSEFLANIQAILGDHFRAMYLSGSLALGDFDPRSSDIDVVVVTGAVLPEALFVALREMHARVAASGAPWTAHVEAVYIPEEALRRTGAIASTARYPQIEKGESLTLDHLEGGWSVQCYTLREHGVVVAGPDPRMLIDPVDPDAMRRAGTALAAAWLEQARHDPSWLAWLRQRANQAFVVLTLCRVLYTLDTGAVASKPAAARWAQRAVDERWRGLIERSVGGQHDSKEIPESDVNDTVALIQYTVERRRQPSARNAVIQ